MRKKIMVSTLFVAFAVITGMNVYNAQKSDVELSGLALENVEALASGEGSGNGYTELSGLICSKCGKEFTGCLYCTEDPNTCDCQAKKHSC